MGFLYGASIQGIQKFIFETGKLKDIVGASELVEEISSNMYKNYIDEKKVEKIVSAAGNIRLYSEDKQNFEKIVKKFPKDVLLKAPGITISQAVVECKNYVPSQDEFIELEKLLKIQRNKPVRPIEITALGIERSRRTGKSAIKRDNGDLIDAASEMKINKSQSLSVYKKILKDDFKINENEQDVNEHLFAKDFKDIISEEKSSWLAVIHADGNSLGKTIQTIFKESEDIITKYKEFSENLNDATIQAAKKAFNDVIVEDYKKMKKEYENENQENNTTKKLFFPFRPLILGGDDLTVVCRADLALNFTKKYLEEFETETENKVGKRLTACAGIAFIKEKYPFHYGVNLAEELCGYAKSASKKVKEEKNLDYVPASLMFHKVKSSFVDDFKDIKERELFAKASNIYFDFGPYAIKENDADKVNLNELKELEEKLDILTKKEAPKSSLRRYISELNKDKEAAKQFLIRLREITNDYYDNKLELNKELSLLDKEESKTIIYDLLTILSLEGGE